MRLIYNGRLGDRGREVAVMLRYESKMTPFFFLLGLNIFILKEMLRVACKYLTRGYGSSLVTFSNKKGL